MSNIIEELFYGNLEPQELTTEITPKLKKKLNELIFFFCHLIINLNNALTITSFLMNKMSKYFTVKKDA